MWQTTHISSLTVMRQFCRLNLSHPIAPAQWNIMFSENGWTTATTFAKLLVEVWTLILLNCLTVGYSYLACKYVSMTLLQVLLHLFFVLGVHTVRQQALIRWAFEPSKLGRHWGRIKRRNRALRPPPHMTHILQPLDVGFFASLKSNWNSVQEEYCLTRAAYGQFVTRETFCQVLLVNYRYIRILFVTAYRSNLSYTIYSQ